ncbi:hypothetical protein [Spiroplasma endosymbiont of Cleonymus obscurus]|uniref:hypothetical protein n=1 Tax=Spiroplasma endosymbiont of Cleonymus obscurus TaxID=3066324 RepID=UPI0037DCC3E3
MITCIKFDCVFADFSSSSCSSKYKPIALLFLSCLFNDKASNAIALSISSLSFSDTSSDCKDNGTDFSSSSCSSKYKPIALLFLSCLFNDKASNVIALSISSLSFSDTSSDCNVL